VQDVSFSVNAGETLAIVGESGCGKTITALSLMRLIPMPPGEITAGSVKVAGTDLLALSEPQMRRMRGSEIAMIFQEPMTSLNPLHSIGNQIAETVMLHQNVGHAAAFDRAEEMLHRVHISAPKQRLREYPHQLSGGMRQRVMIAMALSCNPSILVADEPTTALDVTVQAQIIDLMLKLQDDFKSSIMMITHNLGVVSQMADNVAVMYMGKVVEYAPKRELFHHPLHPYTVGLLNSVPVLGRKKDKLVPIKGMVPSAATEIRGCAFAARCPHVMKKCIEVEPPLGEITLGHQAACWLHE